MLGVGHRDAEGPHIDRETVVGLWTVWHAVICRTARLRNGKKAPEPTVGQALRNEDAVRKKLLIKKRNFNTTLKPDPIQVYNYLDPLKLTHQKFRAARDRKSKPGPPI